VWDKIFFFFFMAQVWTLVVTGVVSWPEWYSLVRLVMRFQHLYAVEHII